MLTEDEKQAYQYAYNILKVDMTRVVLDNNIYYGDVHVARAILAAMNPSRSFADNYHVSIASRGLVRRFSMSGVRFYCISDLIKHRILARGEYTGEMTDERKAKISAGLKRKHAERSTKGKKISEQGLANIRAGHQKRLQRLKKAEDSL